MAIKISGTTVIDNSRNASNLGTVSTVNLTATGNVNSATLTSTGALSSASISTGTISSTGSITSANTYSNTYVESTKTVSQPLASQAVSLDLKSHQNFEHTLANNVTYTFANPPAGSSFGFTLKITQDSGASGYTVSWPAAVDWPSGTAPTLTATANGVDMFVFSTSDAGTTYYGFVAGQALA